MDGPTPITDKEIGEMIADLVYTDQYPDRLKLARALAELRDLRRRWNMFAHCFPYQWMQRAMIWLSRKKNAPG